MNCVEYINKKNDICMEYLGVILVPPDQVVEVDGLLPAVDGYHNGITSNCCIYCLVYRDNRKGLDNCHKCPMYKAGNGCLDHKDCTFDTVSLEETKLELAGKHKPFYDALSKLEDQYNAELDEENLKRVKNE